MDRTKLLQWGFAALVGLLAGVVGGEQLPTNAQDVATCVVDAGWKASMDAHVRAADMQLAGVSRDVREIRELLAELRGRGVFQGGPGGAP